MRRFQNGVLSFYRNINLADQSFMLIIALLIGITGGYAGIGIQFLIKIFHQLFWHSGESLDWLRQLPWWWKLLVPMIGGLMAGLVVQFVSSEAKGHGVPEVMEALLLQGGRIRPRVVLAKLFSSALYIASGGSVGREGPVIQIGSAIGSTVGQFLRVNSNRMRTLVASGAAAGIAAAFNAPVAGALFAIEIVLGDFGVMQFSPIVVSSVAATVVSRHYLGDFPAFHVPHYEMVSPVEYLFYAVLGVLAGLAGLLFIKMLYAAEEFADRQKMPVSLQATLGGLMIGIIGNAFPQIFGVGYDSIDSALQSGLVWQLALALILVKVIATSISLGSGGSGGIFAPSLFMGAMTGAFFGGVLNLLFPEVTANAGAYALVGMGGVVAATTHGPITAILIIFEMTNDYTTILPLMLTVIIATLLSLKFSPHSIYTLKLFRRGIDLRKGHEVNVLRSVKVAEVYHRSIETIKHSARFVEVLERLGQSDHTCFHVVDQQERITGVISMHEIRQTLADYEELRNLLIVADIQDPNITTIRESDSLDLAMKAFGRYHLDEMAVLSDDGKRILGSIQKSDVIQTYNRLISLKDMSDQLSTGIRFAREREAVEVLDKHFVREVEVPREFLGQRIVELDIRNRYEVEVLLILPTREDSEDTIQPNAMYLFKEGDRMLVFGSRKQVEQF